MKQPADGVSGIEVDRELGYLPMVWEHMLSPFEK